MSDEDIVAPPLTRLCRLVGEGLGGPPASPTEIDAQLIALARRHQVAPLLFGVVRGGRHAIAPSLLSALEQDYRASAARRSGVLARLDVIAARFAAGGVTWMVLKGTTQAALLYADPAWRESADIDILVPQAEFARALDALVALGFVASYPPIPARGIVRGAVLATIRDVMMVARDDLSCSIELHRRIFFAGGRHADALRLPVAPGAIPMPAMGPDLAFYLIAHGALSYWVRLKWLVDLLPLFARLSDAERLAVLERARRVRAENSVAASLLLLRALFPFAALGPLHPWLDQRQARPGVRRRLRRYLELLQRADDQKNSPLNDARVMLEASCLLFEAPSTRARILLAAPFSSATRRLAGLLYRADRALTLPEAMAES